VSQDDSELMKTLEKAKREVQDISPEKSTQSLSQEKSESTEEISDEKKTDVLLKKLQKKDEQPAEEKESTSVEFSAPEKFQMFTVNKKDKSITLRNIKLQAKNMGELEKNISQHKGDYILVKNNKIMKTNCFKKKYEYQRLIGFAVLENYLKPKASNSEDDSPASGERILAWVEGSGPGKDIVWKKDADHKSDGFQTFFAQHEKKWEGIVSMMVDSDSGELKIDQHHKKMRMPR